MNRGSFLKSLVTLIVAPSVIAQIEEPILDTDISWHGKAEEEFWRKYYEEAERQMWYSKPSQHGVGIWEQLQDKHRFTYSAERHLQLTTELKDSL